MPKARNGSSRSSARERLLHAAIARFSTRGYAATSIREIVEAAGVTKPALYYHFESKEGIYRAILDAVAATLESTIEAGLAGGGSVRARVERLFLTLYAVFEREKAAVRFLNSVFWGPKQGTPPFEHQELERTVMTVLQEVISEGIASGELRRVNAGDASRVLAAVLSHAMDLALVFPRQAQGKAGLRRALDLVFQGLAAPSPQPERAS
jgi:TetR/AcrR family transcriptional regulator